MNRRFRFFLIICGGVPSAAIIFLLFGLFRSFPFTADRLQIYDPIRKGDLIVCCAELASNERINYALRLKDITGTPNLYYPGICDSISFRNANLDSCFGHAITCGNIKVRTTFDEAVATRQFLKQNTGLRSIIVVTSPFHSFRAKWIFKRILHGYDVISCPVPVKESWYDPAKIKKNNVYYKRFRDEQLKYAFYYIFYSLQFWL